MQRPTITAPGEFDPPLDELAQAQSARPSLTSAVDAALASYLAARADYATFTSRVGDVLRLRSELVERAHARGATALGIFGSVARSADGPNSDIDFWVEVGPNMGMFDLAALREDFALMLGASVDVLTMGGLPELDRATLRAASLVL